MNNYFASHLTIIRCDNGFVITVSMWDQQVIVVASDTDQLVDLVRKIEWRQAERVGQIHEYNAQTIPSEPRGRPNLS